ncbi:amidohydrolase family protein [Nocardioides sp. URHA0020]|uniref:amidohydrolase family protein n=1 Tax=Nocardioides sp. URHA0020 TaxID=1380392 RepID=UPI00056AD4C9|nr:amidohydrolase family protein [Nocardioides sp. URHA0020]
MTAHRIDVHAHFPVDLRHGPDPRRAPWARWDTDHALRQLDRLRIRRQYLSLPALPVHRAPDDQPSPGTVARAVNDKFAEIITDAPERFGAFATVPGDDIDAAVAEARRALDDLGLHGIALGSNAAGRYLGDPWYEPLFAEAAARDVPVFVHPAQNPLAGPLALDRPPFLVEFPLDTFRSVVDAVYAGVFSRHPELRVVVAHCGGALPALAWRVSSLAGLVAPRDEHPGATPAEVAASLSGLYLDTALSGSPGVLSAAIDLVGADHILYGTDSGAAPHDVIVTNTDGLAQAGLTRAELAGIEHDNAAALFSHAPGA